MPSFIGFSSLAPKAKNLFFAGGLSGFVLSVYYYTMRAVGGTDELQNAINKFEDRSIKNVEATASTTATTHIDWSGWIKKFQAGLAQK